MQLLGLFNRVCSNFFTQRTIVLFFYPLWHNLKKYVVVYRALEGINAVVVGLMWAATLYLLKDVSISTFNNLSFLNIGVIAGTLVHCILKNFLHL